MCRGVILDDTACQRETEPPPTLTSRHPRAEDIAVHPSGDASPRIGDINVDPLIFEYVLERDLPLTLHSIDGVLDEILEDPCHKRLTELHDDSFVL